MLSLYNFQDSQGLAVFGFARAIIQRAEVSAGHSSLGEVLNVLRELSMEDFAKLFVSMPNSDFPNLSRLLPRMAEASVQQQWTGFDGMELLSQTVAFARIVETSFVRYTGRSLQNTHVLDFGVGYGRNVRSMLYYTDPHNIYGVDAWPSSLKLSKDDGVPGNLLLSDPSPERLPVDDRTIDVAFAFSIFTHLSPGSAIASLGAIRKALKPDGIGVFTIRPKEYWLLRNQKFTGEQGEMLILEHERSGLAFIPHSYSKDGSYGDTSMEASFFEQNGWQLLGYETTMTDPYQVSVIVCPR